jgi:hypothetical protein
MCIEKGTIYTHGQNDFTTSITHYVYGVFFQQLKTVNLIYEFSLGRSKGVDKRRTVVNRLKSEIVGSNPAQTMYVRVFRYCE